MSSLSSSAITSLVTITTKLQINSMNSNDHVFVDEHGISHVFIEYSASDNLDHTYGGYSSIGIPFSEMVHDLTTESKNTFELKYGKKSIRIPNYHPVVNFVPKKSTNIINISQVSIALILVMMDDHPRRGYFMRFSDHEEEFDNLVIQNLQEISMFANIYNIQPIFKYIETILIPTTSFALYKLNVDKYYSKLNETEIKTLADKVLLRSFDINSNCVQSSINRLINKRHRSVYWMLVSECKRNDSVFYNKLGIFHELLLDDIDREAKYKSNNSIKFINVYQIINFASEHQPVSLTSKFLKHYLEIPTICKFDLKKIKPLLQEFDVYKDIRLPNYLLGLVKLNLLILSMNKYDRTPNCRYISNKENVVTEF